MPLRNVENGCRKLPLIWKMLCATRPWHCNFCQFFFVVVVLSLNYIGLNWNARYKLTTLATSYLQPVKKRLWSQKRWIKLVEQIISFFWRNSKRRETWARRMATGKGRDLRSVMLLVCNCWCVATSFTLKVPHSSSFWPTTKMQITGESFWPHLCCE